MDIKNVYRRENILWNAIDIIHQCGIHSVSTKVIAKRLGISEGTVFNHFPKKNDLIKAVLEQFSMYDEDIFRTAEKKKAESNEAILFYIDSYVGYYENYPAITSLIHGYDMVKGVAELEEIAHRTFLTRFLHMKRLIEDAQEAGAVSKAADAEVLADVVTSTFRGICIRWRISAFSFSLREKMLHAVRMILDAFDPNINNGV